MWTAASPPALEPVINERRGSRDTCQRPRTHGTTSLPMKSANQARFARSSSRDAPDASSIKTATSGGIAPAASSESSRCGSGMTVTYSPPSNARIIPRLVSFAVV